MPAPQRVVEMPDGEAGVMLMVELQHPLQLVHRRAPQRRLAHPPVDQPQAPASAWRPRQRRNVRSLTPSAAAASTWLKTPVSQRSSNSSKRITPILERIPARPSRPKQLERL